MIGRSAWFAALLVLAGALATPFSALASALVVDRVVVLMRHGVRSPTHEPPLPKAIAPDPWPAWRGQPGDLTLHGAAALRLLGAYERGRLGRDAVLAPAGCPAPGSVLIHADVDRRTIASGKAFAQGFAPGCALAVDHLAKGPDPLFIYLDDGVVRFDPARASAAIRAAAGGRLADAVATHRALFDGLQAVLDPGSHALLDLPSRLIMHHGSPKPLGPLKIGKTASEILLLEYEQGLPMREVGWGRVDRAGIARLLALHPLAGSILHRPPYIAGVVAAPLATHLLALLTRTGPRRFALLVGHDTTIDELGGLLDLHWHPAGFPADDPPPGAMLGFMHLTDRATGAQYVEAFFQVQTMDQVRDLTPLIASRPPDFIVLPIPSCKAVAAGPGLCPLADFRRLIEHRIAA